MKKWAFVSDFDGTISKEDFYIVMMDKYFPEGRELFKKWRAGELKDIDFLSSIFQSINQEEGTIIEDILNIPIDEYVPDFIKRVQNSGADFYILSAGTDYYIHHLLKKYGIENVKVFSNRGFYRDRNVYMDINPDEWHYSERYGIDKSKVIQKLKEQYEAVYFAGDSEPDSHPAVYADMTFAKSVLQDMLREKEVPFIPVQDFKEVEDYLVEKGVLSS
jgi:2-hydroxy-3-keto-5-methylthiopentenyl-1-phosphate phosphatase